MVGVCRFLVVVVAVSGRFGLGFGLQVGVGRCCVAGWGLCWWFGLLAVVGGLVALLSVPLLSFLFLLFWSADGMMGRASVSPMS